jgi:hypothetical protein
LAVAATASIATTAAHQQCLMLWCITRSGALSGERPI